MGISVLLVEDDADDRRLASVVLEHGLPGVSVVLARDAVEFVARLDEGGFVAAIAPSRLAFGDGIAVLATVKRRHPECGTILLGPIGPREVEAAVASPAVDVVLAKSSRGLTSLPARVRALSGVAPGCGGAAAAEGEPLAPGNGPGAVRELAVTLSHDLQEPLDLVVRAARRIAAGAEAGAGSAPGHVAERILANAERMQRTLDSVARGASVTAAPPAREPVSLDAVLDEVLGDLADAIDEAGARVERAALPTVVGDPHQLRRLLENLVGNALKFRGERAPQVAVQGVERPREWMVSVSDNGIGIDPADAERVFTMFTRLHGPHEYPGSGVGLAICRRIARAHGGDVWVQSTPGGGATFYFTIPKP